MSPCRKTSGSPWYPPREPWTKARFAESPVERLSTTTTRICSESAHLHGKGGGRSRGSADDRAPPVRCRSAQTLRHRRSRRGLCARRTYHLLTCDPINPAPPTTRTLRGMLPLLRIWVAAYSCKCCTGRGSAHTSAGFAQSSGCTAGVATSGKRESSVRHEICARGSGWARVRHVRERR